jgi:hypothetical protein
VRLEEVGPRLPRLLIPCREQPEREVAEGHVDMLLEHGLRPDHHRERIRELLQARPRGSLRKHRDEEDDGGAREPAAAPCRRPLPTVPAISANGSANKVHGSSDMSLSRNDSRRSDRAAIVARLERVTERRLGQHEDRCQQRAVPEPIRVRLRDAVERAEALRGVVLIRGEAVRVEGEPASQGLRLRCSAATMP